MPTTITYDEQGVIYDDACYLYDGINICQVPPVAPLRPSYWRGFGGTDDSGRRKPKKKWLSLAVTAKCLSINGYDIDFSVRSEPVEIRYAGEDDDTEVFVQRAKVTVVTNPYDVQATTLLTHPADLEVAVELVDGETLDEPEGSYYEGTLEGEEEINVSGEITQEGDVTVVSVILTDADQDLTLSCSPVTKSSDPTIITIQAVSNERDEDSKDES